ncbi:ABC transporter permease [Herbaspirillum autotrophicum]|uniref:ABC transporter permease n=1 Tax=Herbaspirillum autotrophicum TaxID=180195 RepID=UPI00067DC4B1|nr:ABC transporter permease [Herbaspirillum autotrophicum]
MKPAGLVAGGQWRQRWRSVRRFVNNGPVLVALAILFCIIAAALLAPWLNTIDPSQINPSERLSGFSAENWFGTDALGRDVYSRVVYGARISLIIGAGVALTSMAAGLLIGVVAGYFRAADAIIMRIMDGLMAIPGILLAIALVSLSGASLMTVLVAITIPEIPRVVRLVRSIILSIRSEPYVEAAVTLGTRLPTLLMRHVIPNTIAPLIVQGTYVCASAMLTEAVLSFLGVGISPEVPSWGNIMAEGRMYFQLFPSLILCPGIFLSLVVLSVNLLGDAMRDYLDPKMAEKL